MSYNDQLILIRHSLPEIVENIPAHKLELSDEGRTRAGRLAEALEQYQLKIIGSSVEPKARETAEILCQTLGVDIVVIDRLHEHERSSISFRSKDDFQIPLRELFEKPDEIIFGDEAATQALERFKGSVEMLMDLYTGKQMAIVSHGTVISLFTSWLSGVDGYLLWKDLGMPAIVVLDMINKKLLKTINIS